MELESLIEQIENRNFDDILRLFNNEQVQQLVDENIFDVVGVLCELLAQSTLSQEERKQFEKILQRCVSIANPKEIIMAILEQANKFHIEDFFLSILKPIQLSLSKIPRKKGVFLKWILSGLYAHIISIPVSYSDENNSKEKDSDEVLLKLTYSYINFFEELIREFGSTRKIEQNTNEVKDILIFYLLKLLEHPLVYMDLKVSKQGRSNLARECATKVVKQLTQLEPNIMNLICNSIKNIDSKVSSDENLSTNIETYVAQGNLSYLIFCEGLRSYPCIFTHQYIFESCMGYIFSLLTKPKSLVVHKGLTLSHTLIEKLQNCSLTIEYLDEINYNIFPKYLLELLSQCPEESLRSLSREIMLSYFNKFDLTAKYNLICSLWKSNDHPGIRAFILVIFKKHLFWEYNINPLDSLNKIILDNALREFLPLVLSVSGDPNLDVVEENGSILEALTFICSLAMNKFKVLFEEDLMSIINGYIKIVERRKLICLSIYKDQISADNSDNQDLPGFRPAIHSLQLIDFALDQAKTLLKIQ